MNPRSFRITLALIASAALVATPALAADTLDVKLGLWQMEYHIKTSGTGTVPAASLEKMTPEQRAKYEKAMAAAQRNLADQNFTERTCVTPEDLEQAEFGMPDTDDDEKCTTTVVTQTKTKLEARVACQGPSKRTGTARFEMTGREQMTGAMEFATSSGRMTMDLKGKWLSASCKGATDE
jgi:Spy/CpxP family protein refolding chaperone